MSKRIEKNLVNCLVNSLESGEFEVRKCDVCGSYIIIVRHCIEDRERHYCSDGCMTSEMTIEEEYNELYNYGEVDPYFEIMNMVEEFKFAVMVTLFGVHWMVYIFTYFSNKINLNL